jgi:hypothetical protein
MSLTSFPLTPRLTEGIFKREDQRGRDFNGIRANGFDSLFLLYTLGALPKVKSDSSGRLAALRPPLSDLHLPSPTPPGPKMFRLKSLKIGTARLRWPVRAMRFERRN